MLLVFKEETKLAVDFVSRTVGSGRTRASIVTVSVEIRAEAGDKVVGLVTVLEWLGVFSFQGKFDDRTGVDWCLVDRGLD